MANKSSYVYAELAGIKITVAHLKAIKNPELQPVLDYLLSRILELEQ